MSADPTAPAAWTRAPERYRAKVHAVSGRTVDAQRPCRILDASSWNGAARDAFLESGAERLPPVAPACDEPRPPGSDPGATRAELNALEAARDLGGLNPPVL